MEKIKVLRTINKIYVLHNVRGSRCKEKKMELLVKIYNVKI